MRNGRKREEGQKKSVFGSEMCECILSVSKFANKKDQKPSDFSS